MISVASILSSWAPVLIWAGLIFYLSSIPGLKTNLGVWDTVLRKGAHIFEYAVLTGLLYRAFRRTWTNQLEKRVLAWAGGLALIYAFSDELHQYFVPRRGPSLHDVAIDAIGIMGVLYYLHRAHAHS